MLRRNIIPGQCRSQSEHYHHGCVVLVNRPRTESPPPSFNREGGARASEDVQDPLHPMHERRWNDTIIRPFLTILPPDSREHDSTESLVWLERSSSTWYSIKLQYCFFAHRFKSRYFTFCLSIFKIS